MPASDLDLYEIAFLAGGADRVVDTAVVALVETGRVRITSPGQLALVDPARRHHVEGAVLDAIGVRGHRSLDLVVWRLAGDDRIAEVGRRLAAAGLLSRRPALRLRAGGPPTRTTAGRRQLQALEAAPPVFSVHDGGNAVQVALRGPRGMSDERLRQSIFGAPRTTISTGAAEVRQRTQASRRNSPYDARHSGFGGDAGGGFDGGGVGGGVGGGDGGGF